MFGYLSWNPPKVLKNCKSLLLELPKGKYYAPCQVKRSKLNSSAGEGASSSKTLTSSLLRGGSFFLRTRKAVSNCCYRSCSRFLCKRGNSIICSCSFTGIEAAMYSLPTFSNTKSQ
ncbi:hypothetical protein Mp_2g01340 [Marchantia polymorpha subsp. ruderalis]|uniref:Uncharacterized protein n=1 Tax=Marchantia polymorpha TaxID=3197 RepID=A0A2R6X9C9_MARPO|nr:hypothetical protein MARPO_0028s0018 [Marchantia polymorpha]BBN00704.1 hypothetical protein Mp_2g01340 [Marchantia polymorpha subsp. ruderalis]|eukprot:PTQ42692.1 hypothetical protein MARPO_0028s0018 [Marchantia polymorpha]